MKKLLLIIPLTISLSAFGQIKRSNPKGGSLKNTPAVTHRPAVKAPKPVFHSAPSVVRPTRTRPSSSSSSSRGNNSSSSSSSNHNTTYYTSGRNESNNYNSTYGGSAQMLVGFTNICGSTGGDVVRTSPYNLVNTLIEKIERYAGDSTDIVILIDVSGSMGNNVKSIASESDAIIVALPQGCRLGAASFRLSNSPSWYKHSDLSEDHWNALDFISRKRKYMNSESHLDAIVKTVSSSSWINNKRMIITITDEMIAPSENMKTQAQAIHSANKENVSPHTIFLEN